MIVYPSNAQENDGLKEWVQTRVKDYRPGPYTVCVAVVLEGQIVAVVAWDNFRGRDIEVTFASDTPRWLTKNRIRTLLMYPFGQLGVMRITAMIHKSNKRSRRFTEGIGFLQEGKHRHAGPNLESVFSYGLTREDFEKRYGFQRPADTAAAA